MVQIDIAIPFLAISGVMLDRVRTADFGFQADGLVAVRLPVPAGQAREAGAAIRRVRDTLTQANGVRSRGDGRWDADYFDSRRFERPARVERSS